MKNGLRIESKSAAAEPAPLPALERSDAAILFDDLFLPGDPAAPRERPRRPAPDASARAAG